jgi:hypothetical protein
MNRHEMETKFCREDPWSGLLKTRWAIRQNATVRIPTAANCLTKLLRRRNLVAVEIGLIDVRFCYTPFSPVSPGQEWSRLCLSAIREPQDHTGSPRKAQSLRSLAKRLPYDLDYSS